MASTAKKAFLARLRDEFAPAVRELGFKGGGSNFRRIRGEVIHAINIQGDKYGGSVAVNLGMHLAFRPVYWSDELPDLSTIKEVDCSFRDRLAPGKRADYWWKYEGAFHEPLERAGHLTDTFLRYGEPRFAEYDTVEKIAQMYVVQDIESDRELIKFGFATAPFMALEMGLINLHIGRNDVARQFAEAGLKKLDGGADIEQKLRALLDQT